MTSNIGSHFILEENSPEVRNKKVLELLKQSFKPEFLNRIDETVVFGQLEKTQLREIVGNTVSRLNQMLRPKGLELDLTAAATDLLCELGYDRNYGARPMKRVFQREIQNPLASEILAGKYPAGSKIRVDSKGSQFLMSKGNS